MTQWHKQSQLVRYTLLSFYAGFKRLSFCKTEQSSGAPYYYYTLLNSWVGWCCWWSDSHLWLFGLECWEPLSSSQQNARPQKTECCALLRLLSRCALLVSQLKAYRLAEQHLKRLLLLQQNSRAPLEFSGIIIIQCCNPKTMLVTSETSTVDS